MKFQGRNLIFFTSNLYKLFCCRENSCCFCFPWIHFVWTRLLDPLKLTPKSPKEVCCDVLLRCFTATQLARFFSTCSGKGAWGTNLSFSFIWNLSSYLGSLLDCWLNECTERRGEVFSSRINVFISLASFSSDQAESRGDIPESYNFSLEYISRSNRSLIGH